MAKKSADNALAIRNAFGLLISGLPISSPNNLLDNGTECMSEWQVL